MKVAIITPYYREPPDQIEQCLGSVRGQTSTAAIKHYLISDGFPQDIPADPSIVHVRLPTPHGDYGNTPRGIGSMLAVSEGADVLMFLDADNYLDADHVEMCLAAASGGQDIVVARRRIVTPDGRVLIEDPDGSDFTNNYPDTNCVILMPGAVHLAHYWAIQPKQLTVYGDYVFWNSLRAQPLSGKVLGRATINYRTVWRVHYEQAGETPPPEARPETDVEPLIKWWKGLSPREREVVNRRVGFPVHLDRMKTRPAPNSGAKKS